MRLPKLQRRLFVVAVALAVLLIGPAAAPAAVESGASSAASEFFERSVRPLFLERCAACHGPEVQEANLRLDRPDDLFDPQREPRLVAPGDPQRSRLVALVRGTGDLQMPPDDRLSDPEIAALERWIADGAVWPGYSATAAASPQVQLAGDASFSEAQRAYWAFQPIQDPIVPASTGPAWPQSAHAVDRFLAARLDRSGIPPAAPADKRSLLRRVTYDLTGLLPTPDETAAFLADDSPEAFAAVVERLLASPRYGEQWGRHWLDVARYAESAGHDGNNAYLYAWRYRDYVIKSFNDDKPYDQFIIEQLAGDLLEKSGDPQTDYERTVATGFLQVGPKPVVMRDKRQMLLDIADEQVHATGVAFMGLTLGCARCHDHKFDPIPTADYYSLAGIFASTQVMVDDAPDSMWLESAVPDGTGLGVKAMTVRDQPAPADLRIHLRGNYRTLGPVAPRRFLQIIAGGQRPAIHGSGRLDLARWIASPANPLTARVMVNRIWQHHFGRGLVATSGNFGALGAAPTHPELLDWLATRLVESGWSVKAVHRLILASLAYQQSSIPDPTAALRDPDNRLLGRMPVRRLAAEEIRDSLLALGESLDVESRGTLFTEGYAPGDPKRELYVVDVSGKDPFPPFEAPRRSVYLPVLRNARPEILKLFDVANEHEPCPVRSETTVPLQSLYLLNSPFMQRAAESLLERASRDVGVRSAAEAANPAALLDRLYALVLGRPPEETERSRSFAFLDAYAAAAGGESAASGAAAARTLAWKAAVQALLCSNEFMYVR